MRILRNELPAWVCGMWTEGYGKLYPYIPHTQAGSSFRRIRIAPRRAEA